MSMLDKEPAYTISAAIAIVAVAIAVGFGPNCERPWFGSDDEPTPVVQKSKPKPPKRKNGAVVATPSFPDVDCGDDTRMLKIRERFIHTRVQDCEEQFYNETGRADGMLRCMWWVFGSNHPKEFDVDPAENDGPLGYRGRPPPKAR